MSVLCTAFQLNTAPTELFPPHAQPLHTHSGKPIPSVLPLCTTAHRQKSYDPVAPLTRMSNVSIPDLKNKIKIMQRIQDKITTINPFTNVTQEKQNKNNIKWHSSKYHVICGNTLHRSLDQLSSSHFKIKQNKTRPYKNKPRAI